MTLKLSLVIGGDASGAKSAGNETVASLSAVRAESARASAAVAGAANAVKTKRCCGCLAGQSA